jgi:hypothetical protein
MRIIFDRTGGFMGLKSSLTVDLTDLPLDQAETLSRLVDEAHFFTLTENPSISPHPDGFQYTITVEADTTTHTLHTSDTSAPEELRPLLQELTQMARSQRKP